MTTLKNKGTKPRKPYTVRTKPIHHRVLSNLVENGGDKGKAIRDAGYSESMVHTPSKVLESKGFIQALEQSGLDIETLNGYLAHDLKKKKENRLGELTLAYKLHGKLRETVSENKTLILITSGESATRYNVPTTPHSLPSD
jgi:hypothetical protein